MRDAQDARGGRPGEQRLALRAERDPRSISQGALEPLPGRVALRRARPLLEPERREATTATAIPRNVPAMPTGRSHTQRNDSLRLPAAQAGAEQHPQRRGALPRQFAHIAARPPKSHPLPGQLLHVAALLAPRHRQADRQREHRLPQHEHEHEHHPNISACLPPARYSASALNVQRPVSRRDHVALAASVEEPIESLPVVLLQRGSQRRGSGPHRDRSAGGRGAEDGEEFRRFGHR